MSAGIVQLSAAVLPNARTTHRQADRQGCTARQSARKRGGERWPALTSRAASATREDVAGFDLVERPVADHSLVPIRSILPLPEMPERPGEGRSLQCVASTSAWRWTCNSFCSDCAERGLSAFRGNRDWRTEVAEILARPKKLDDGFKMRPGFPIEDLGQPFCGAGGLARITFQVCAQGHVRIGNRAGSEAASGRTSLRSGSTDACARCVKLRQPALGIAQAPAVQDPASLDRNDSRQCGEDRRAWRDSNKKFSQRKTIVPMRQGSYPFCGNFC